MEQSEEELLKEYFSGSEKAAQMIFFRYKTRILNFCLRMLGNRADAEDVTSDVFLALSAQRYSCNAGAKFSTWLYTVARNRCISQIRRRKNLVSMWFSSHEGADPQSLDPQDPQELADQQLESNETALVVQRAIGALSYEQKEAIILREYHQLSYEEISEILHCSKDKVKILIFRGRERLRTELSSLIGEDNR